MACPCGLPQAYEACCGRFLGGRAQPATAEELMRSRYTAYTRGDADYLIGTCEPSQAPTREDIESWSSAATFTGLEILGKEGGGVGDDEGTVEFIARYDEARVSRVHHERSLFRREGGRWLYAGDVNALPAAPVVPKVGRNEPCPCGSGKKYKKCCGQ